MIRLIIQQPTLAKYRVPVFRELARRPGIALKLYYGERENLPNVAAEDFDAEMIPLHERSVGRNLIFWHRAQWDYATRRHADVLMLTWNPRYASLVPALVRARAHGVPTILWGHGYSKDGSAWRTALRDGVAKLATALLFYNHRVAGEFRSMGWDPQRIYVAPNSLEQAPIQQARQAWLDPPDRLDQFRHQQDLEDRPLVLYVSRIDPTRRLDLLVQAAARLVPRFPRLAIALIGSGESETARLKELARRLDVQSHIRWLGALYDETQLAPWFLSARVFCYPENIGLSLLHAFGYGLPVITCHRLECHGPEIEALRDGHNGLFYEQGNAESLAEAMQRLLENSHEASRMGSAAMATVRDEFNIHRMVDGMEAAVRFCASHGGTTTSDGITVFL